MQAKSGKIILIIIVALLLFIAVPFFSCKINDLNINGEDEKMPIMVSIPPLSEFVEKLGGDMVKTTIMVPPGANPHIYEPVPGQLRKVEETRMFVKAGSGIEFELEWMDRLIKMNQDMIIVDCSRGVELIEAGPEQGSDTPVADPHIWLSPGNVQIMVENIYNGLVEIDPGNRAVYQENKDNYLKELEVLDDGIKAKLSARAGGKIIVFHPAWAYFARDYRLEIFFIEEGGKEPTPGDMERIIELAGRYQVEVIFASPESNHLGAETIAREIGGSIIYISPLEKDYLENLRNVAGIFEKHLN